MSVPGFNMLYAVSAAALIALSLWAPPSATREPARLEIPNVRVKPTPPPATPAALELAEVRFTQSQARPGDTAALQVTVQNTGGSASPASFKVWIKRETPAPHEMNVLTFPSVPARGGRITQTINIPLPKTSGSTPLGSLPIPPGGMPVCYRAYFGDLAQGVRAGLAREACITVVTEPASGSSGPKPPPGAKILITDTPVPSRQGTAFTGSKNKTPTDALSPAPAPITAVPDKQTTAVTKSPSTPSQSGSPPGALRGPSGLVLTHITDRSITLAWRDHDTGEIGFYVVGKKMWGDAYVRTKTLPVDTRTHTWSGLEPGKQYCFYLRSFNERGESPKSNTECAFTKVHANAPEPPVNLRLSEVTDKSIRLTWRDQATNEIGYYVVRDDDPGSTRDTTTTHTIGANRESFVWSGLRPGKEHCFYVKAFGQHGKSQASNRECATTKKHAQAPEMPAALRIEETGPIEAVSVTIHWKNVATDATGLRIKATEYGGKWKTREVAVDLTRYTWSPLKPNTRYCFTVVAYNAHGESVWPDRICTRTKTHANAPKEPTHLRLTGVTDTSMTLEWKDNADNETGYYVVGRRYRRILGGSGYMEYPGSEAHTHTLPANTTRHTWTGLDRGGHYCFYIRAFNESGKSARTPRRCDKARDTP